MLPLRKTLFRNTERASGISLLKYAVKVVEMGCDGFVSLVDNLNDVLQYCDETKHLFGIGGPDAELRRELV